MLLELALLGLIDAPEPGEVVVLSGSADDPRLDAALRQLGEPSERVEPDVAAVRLGRAVGASAVDALDVQAITARVRQAIVRNEAPDIRTALLVWLLKQDYVGGRAAFETLFPRRAWIVGRALRRIRPDLYAHGADDRAAAAHRVLYALLPTAYAPLAGDGASPA